VGTLSWCAQHARRACANDYRPEEPRSARGSKRKVSAYAFR